MEILDAVMWVYDLQLGTKVKTTVNNKNVIKSTKGIWCQSRDTAQNSLILRGFWKATRVETKLSLYQRWTCIWSNSISFMFWAWTSTSLPSFSKVVLWAHAVWPYFIFFYYTWINKLVLSQISSKWNETCAYICVDTWTWWFQIPRPFLHFKLRVYLLLLFRLLMSYVHGSCGSLLHVH